ncbi:hypothetical protein G7Z17_g3152 [Cylindrodendrum hubeiense]|uniref:NmrA-like domain-containing protein n=1 Tax=Cylindrodendrum hubeiense TaxID=595255 RepID=A0A9P5HCX3_9HYPO|nr:hypothetical protein G7Z17_g3152 [Cylindrodendrum hubeiense]
MLVLIAGITGNLGTRLAKVATSRGLQIRGLGRDPAKLDEKKTGKLESFVTCKTHYDTPALDKAVSGVDAVICAYSPSAVLDLEGHLLLFRAAERAGVTVFLASSWGHPLDKIVFGEYEHYDTHLAFKQQVAMTSSVKPVFMNVGGFADLLYGPFGPGGWNTTGPNPTIEYWGEGNTRKIHWSALDDVAEWTIDLLQIRDVQEGKGGTYQMQSGAATLEEIAAAWTKATGEKVDLIKRGSLEDLESLVYTERKEKGVGRYIEYLVNATSLLHTRGAFVMTELNLTESSKSLTTLDQYLTELLKNRAAVEEYIKSLQSAH